MAAKLQEIFPLAKRNNNKNRRKRSAPRIDYGTPEAVAKRRAIVGVSVKRDKAGVPRIEPNDPTKAYSPAAAMLARGFLSQDQFNATERYAWLYAKATGARTPAVEKFPNATSAICGEAVACPNCEEHDCPAKSIERKWRDACAALWKHPRKVKDAVDGVAVFWHWPRWWFERTGRRNSPRPIDEAGYAALITGLDALVAIGCTVQERKAA
jgi:hypothetical protein